MHIRTREGLKECAVPFEENSNCQKAMRFGDEGLREELKECNEYIIERNENVRLSDIYNDIIKLMRSATFESTFKDCASRFKCISGFKDADELAEKCLEEAEVCRKDESYTAGKNRMGTTFYEAALQRFESIPGYKDADELAKICRKKLEEIKLENAREEEERRIVAEKAAKIRKKVLVIGIPSICVVIAFIILLNTVIIPNYKFRKAMNVLDSGNYDSAYAMLEELGKNDAIASNKYDRAMKLIDSGDYEAACLLLDGLNYKDSDDKLASIKPQRNEILLQKAHVGSHIYFGSYEQDNIGANGKEDIKWLVLERDDNKILVISDKALDCQQYNTSLTSITWEMCSLRKWLNDGFLNDAFNAEEQAQIQNTDVTADINPIYNTNPGNDTTDKVFLLSIVEAEKYFSSASARQCEPTEYVIASDVSDNKGSCWLWLRSPGKHQDKAAIVRMDGTIDFIGYYDYNSAYVRPAMWIEI